MSEGVLGSGGHLVPTPLAARVIDQARNAARVFRAGALTVPMDSNTLKIAKQASDPSVAWHTENEPITDSAITFDAVTFNAKTLPVLVKLSRELLEDGENIDAVVENAISEATSLELDRVALYGSGADPEPLGVRNTSGVAITTFNAPDGGTPTDYNHLIDAFQVLRGGNFDPSGVIQAPRSETTLAKLTDTTGQPKAEPRQVAEIRRYSTNQVPTNLTTGVNSDTSDAFVGEFRHLLVGLRTAFSIQFLRERYADDGQVAFLSWLRGDIQLAHTGAFNVVEGLRS
jgi:HK97 family phage major capsid protein